MDKTALATTMKKKRLFGHTLVELLVAMALSLALMAGVVRAFTDSNMTFAVVTEQALMQENGRFAIGFIEEQVRRAGYVHLIDATLMTDETRLSREFPESPALDSIAIFPAAAVVVGLDNTAETGEFSSGKFQPGSDVLHVRYQRSDGPLFFRDCTGSPLNDEPTDEDDPENSVPNITDIITLFVDEHGSMRCVGRNRTSAALVEGIDSMQILYGIDTDRLDPVTAEKYVTGSEIALNNAGESEWRDVVSIRVAVLASGGLAQRSLADKGQGMTQNYDLLGENIEKDDGRIRDIFEQTINLRNRKI